MPYLFTPPGERRPLGTDRLWSRFRITTSFCLLKKDGFYTLTEAPSDEDFAAADLAYLGGHAYWVSDAEGAALTAAGYGSFLSQPPVTIGSYGSGTYGVGPYGTGGSNAAPPNPSRPYGSGPYGTGTYDGG